MTTYTKTVMGINKEIKKSNNIITSYHHIISSCHHIIMSSYHHIITSLYHYIIISLYHYIISYLFSYQFLLFVDSNLSRFHTMFNIISFFHVPHCLVSLSFLLVPRVPGHNTNEEKREKRNKLYFITQSRTEMSPRTNYALHFSSPGTPLRHNRHLPRVLPARNASLLAL